MKNFASDVTLQVSNLLRIVDVAFAGRHRLSPSRRKLHSTPPKAKNLNPQPWLSLKATTTFLAQKRKASGKNPLTPTAIIPRHPVAVILPIWTLLKWSTGSRAWPLTSKVERCSKRGVGVVFFYKDRSVFKALRSAFREMTAVSVYVGFSLFCWSLFFFYVRLTWFLARCTVQTCPRKIIVNI